MISSGIIFAYMGFQFRDKDVPMKLLFISLAVLMTFASVGIGLRGIEEQAGGSPTVLQSSIISMVEVTYMILVWVFVLTMGYFMVMFIKWTMLYLAQRKHKLEAEELDPKI